MEHCFNSVKVVYKHTLHGMKFSQDMSFHNQMPTPEKLFLWKCVVYMHIDDTMTYWLITQGSELFYLQFSLPW